ncbi:MAG: hypothetical protein QMC67_02390 [Candidatus Wallbacteria bacterium]
MPCFIERAAGDETKKHKTAKSNDNIAKATVDIAGIKKRVLGKSKGHCSFVFPEQKLQASSLINARDYFLMRAAICSDCR